jgi:hypothetical protein
MSPFRVRLETRAYRFPQTLWQPLLDTERERRILFGSRPIHLSEMGAGADAQLLAAAVRLQLCY